MRKIIYYAIVTVFIGLAQVSAASAYSVSFSSPYDAPFSVSSGGPYSVNVILSGIPTGGSVSAFDLDVSYNANYLNANSVSFGSWLGTYSSNFLLTDVLQDAKLGTPGLIEFAAVSFLSDASLQALQSSGNGSITLATLNFTGIADGTSDLAFDWYAGKDVKGNNNEVVFPAPEPGTFLLLGSGMVAFLLFRRRNILLGRFSR